jgi:hypothetical protein
MVFNYIVAVSFIGDRNRIPIMNMNTQNISLRTVMQNSSTMEAVMFVIVWWLDLQLPVQSVHKPTCLKRPFIFCPKCDLLIQV